MSESTKVKFVVLLNKKIEAGIAMNAAAHMAACLVAKASPSDREKMMFIDYIDADGNQHPSSGLSLIVLKADNSNKIRTARELAKEKQILFVDFLQSMTGDTYVEQLDKTKLLKEAELEYFGLCLFGNKEVIDTITGKFSMWKA
jgi:Protein of unknown function (DUF2000)